MAPVPLVGKGIVPLMEGRPVGMDTEPLGAEGRPVGMDTEPLAAEGRPVGADTEPLGGEGRPVGTDIEPVIEGRAVGRVPFMDSRAEGAIGIMHGVPETVTMGPGTRDTPDGRDITPDGAPDGRDIEPDGAPDGRDTEPDGADGSDTEPLATTVGPSKLGED